MYQKIKLRLNKETFKRKLNQKSNMRGIKGRFIFCSGISGSEKKAYVKEVVGYAKKHGDELEVFDVEERMFKIARENKIQIVKEKFLDLPPNTRKALRAAAFESFLKEKRKVPTIILSHACFFWRNDFDHAFDYSYLERIQPDIYTTIICPLYRIKENIQRNPTGIGKELSEQEILNWQSVEVFTTKGLANSQGKQFYLIPRLHSPKTLYNLIFKPKMRKVYLSYPMCFANHSHLSTTKKFREKLEDFFIVFDPGTVSGWGEDFTKTSSKIKDALGSLTVHKDCQLIDQSDAVVAYFPKIIYTTGVDCECMYAAKTNKKVFVIFPSNRVSPFLSINATRIFHSEEEFFNFLKSPAGRI